MFDRSFLPPADLEFVVMTDTHHMLDPGTQQVEFESRRRQAARAAHAYRLVGGLDPAFVVHLGDLIQEFPESPGFEESLEQALAQMRDAGVQVRQVAGNHDVGDKPDPTMPTDWASSESVQAFHGRFGSSWCSWNAAGCHFVILNSQIMNGPLPEAVEQKHWLEADLDAHAAMPTYLFLHLAPFLVREDEQALGHYDNIDEPARSWLLDLVHRHDIRAVFSGHSHFAFFNRIGDARSYVVPSTAFTRPGFCEVFSSPPPPERGRDDSPKLGFFLARAHGGDARIHLIRTGGSVGPPALEPGERRIVTGISRDLEQSHLGITLRHPLSSRTEVPIAWQSTIRQPVRNDYPLLACVELGTRHVRTPAGDLGDDAQRQRLEVLRDEGATLSAYWIWSDRTEVQDEAGDHRELLDTVEMQIPNSLVPDDEALEAIRHCRRELELSVRLAPLLPREVVAGKQHARTRVGYRLEELDQLESFLETCDSAVDRVLCRVGATESPWQAMTTPHRHPGTTRIGTLEWAVELGETDCDAQVARVAESLFGAAASNSQVFIEPLVDLDRTMDAPLGLLDRLCNPRPQFHAARTLNTILHGSGEAWTAAEAPGVPGLRACALESTGIRAVLLLPEAETAQMPISPRDVAGGWDGALRLVRLVAGTIRDLDPDDAQAMITGPSVLLASRSATEEAGGKTA